MKDSLLKIKKYVEDEPYVRLLNIKIRELKEGHSIAVMKAADSHKNLHSMVHGGAIFSLIDVAFGAAANSYGNISVSIGMDINYLKSAYPGDILTAEAVENNRSKRLGSYTITVKNEPGDTIAICQALAYIKKEILPFLKE